MKRRTVLRSLLAAPSVAMLPSQVAAQETKVAPSETPNTPGTEADATADPVVKTFNKAQFAALCKLGDIMMPAVQGTPGASEAGAAEFLDFLIGVSPSDRITLYKTGLDRLNTEAHKRYNKPFAEISVAEAEPILAPLRAPWSYHGPADSFAKFLLAAKADLMTATANSHQYITVVAQRRRGAGGAGQYWYRSE